VWIDARIQRKTYDLKWETDTTEKKNTWIELKVKVVSLLWSASQFWSNFLYTLRTNSFYYIPNHFAIRDGEFFFNYKYFRHPYWRNNTWKKKLHPYWRHQKKSCTHPCFRQHQWRNAMLKKLQPVLPLSWRNACPCGMDSQPLLATPEKSYTYFAASTGKMPCYLFCHLSWQNAVPRGMVSLAWWQNAYKTTPLKFVWKGTLIGK